MPLLYLPTFFWGFRKCNFEEEEGERGRGLEKEGAWQRGEKNFVFQMQKLRKRGGGIRADNSCLLVEDAADTLDKRKIGGNRQIEKKTRQLRD